MKAQLCIYSINEIDDILSKNDIPFLTKKINKKGEYQYILNIVEEDNLYGEEVVQKCIVPFVSKSEKLGTLVEELGITIMIITKVELSTDNMPALYINKDIIDFCYLAKATVDFDFYQ